MLTGPRFEHRDAFFVVGYSDYGAFFENNDISELWDRFIEVMDEVPNKVNPAVCYGVEFYTEEGLAVQKWNYMAALEVSTLEAIPIAMVGKVIPAQMYAVFTHKGSIDTLSHSFKVIYDEWLPTSEYEPAAMFDFELYDERFNHGSPNSEVDIYLPVRHKMA